MIDRKTPPAISELTRLAIQRPCSGLMANGVPLHILNSGDNEVVRIDILMAGGRWHQSQPLQALFANRMLREGTARHAAPEIAEKLDYYGAWLELSSASEHTYVTLYSLNKYLPHTLDILESMVKEPLFPEKELEVVVNNNMRQFLVNSSKVDFLAHRALMNQVYGEGHPCGRLVGEEDYRRITPDVLREFYERHCHSRNCSVYVSGRVTDDCVRRIERAFGDAPFGTDGSAPEKRRFPIVTSPEKRVFVERADARQSAVRMGMTAPGRTHPDFLKARVLVTLFGGYFGSRLMSNIREEKGYTYGISAGLLSYPDSGMLVINTETANEFVEPLIAEVYREIDRLQYGLVSEEELATVRNYMLGEMCRGYESPFSLADAWMFVHTSGLGDTYFDDALRAVRETTPEEIRALAGRHLCKERLKEIVAGKKMS